MAVGWPYWSTLMSTVMPVPALVQVVPLDGTQSGWVVATGATPVYTIGVFPLAGVHEEKFTGRLFWISSGTSATWTRIGVPTPLGGSKTTTSPIE